MIEAQIQTQQTVEQPTQKAQVLTTSQILNDLDNGLDRKAIATKYGLNMTEVKVLFEHPALKGKRPKRALKAISFTLVDDTQAESTPYANHDSQGSDYDIDTQEVEDNTSENWDNEETFNQFNELN